MITQCEQLISGCMVATRAYTTSMPDDQGASSTTVANIYSPMGRVQGNMTLERLEILHSAFQQSVRECPDIQKEYGSPDFATVPATAVSRLLGRYKTNSLCICQIHKTGQEHQADQPLQHTKWVHESAATGPMRNNRAICFTLDTTTPECYFSLYPEDRLFAANLDAYSCKCTWQGAPEVHPEHELAPDTITKDFNRASKQLN